MPPTGSCWIALRSFDSTWTKPTCWHECLIRLPMRAPCNNPLAGERSGANGWAVAPVRQAQASAVRSGWGLDYAAAAETRHGSRPTCLAQKVDAELGSGSSNNEREPFGQWRAIYGRT